MLLTSGVGDILPKPPTKPKTSGVPTDEGVDIKTFAPLQIEKNAAMQVSMIGHVTKEAITTLRQSERCSAFRNLHIQTRLTAQGEWCVLFTYLFFRDVY